MHKINYIPAVKLSLLILGLAFTLQVKATNIDNIRFPERAWNGQVLNLLISGPGYLDKSLEFNLPPPPP